MAHTIPTPSRGTGRYENKLVSFSPAYTVNHYGLGSIWGTVTDSSGNPMQRKLVLLEYWSYMPVQEVISDAVTGYYEFVNLDTMSFFSVVSEDYLDYRYNDIIRAKVQAEVKP